MELVTIVSRDLRFPEARTLLSPPLPSAIDIGISPTVFASNEADVLREMSAFMVKLPK